MGQVMKMMNKGKIVVISGPSGGGKGTVVKALKEIMPDLGVSVSATTRNPREGEADGREYYFVTHETFERMLSDGDILEHTTYCGNYYGTPRKEAERITGEGRDLILEIEVDGAAQVKKIFPDCVTVMLIPPSISVLEDRLRGRGTETEEVILQRLARAKEELLQMKNYDYIVVNNSVEEAAEQIRNILSSESLKTKKYLDFSKDFNCLLVPKKRLELLLPNGN